MEYQEIEKSGCNKGKEVCLLVISIVQCLYLIRIMLVFHLQNTVGEKLKQELVNM